MTTQPPLAAPNLAAFLERVSEAYRDRPAIKQLDAAVTFQELRDYARAFSAHLRAAGVRPGESIVLVVENSIDYAVALLGSQCAGVTTIPISPDSTHESVSRILIHSQARGLIVRERTITRLELSDLPVIAALADTFAANLSRYYQHAPDVPGPDGALASDVAMILYTSGTTGNPKGVMLSHANLISNAGCVIEHLGLTGADKIVNVLPLFHSFGNSVLLTHLAVGAQIVLENRFTFPNVVVDTMQRERPTGFSGVPASFYVLLSRSKFPTSDWSFLRYMNSGGGPLRVGAIRQLRQLIPHTEICITYGQTEAAPRLAYLPPDRVGDKAASIGVAAPGVSLRVVNEEGRDVGPGEVGEIIASGPNIMRGYFQNPDATREALRDGWLHTGDMATIDEEGFIFIVSRKSDFIKHASYRISPLEIEEVIAELPGIEDSAAFGVEDELAGEVIAVCVVCDASAFDASRIRSHCTERLPFFKVPKYIIHDCDLPRTASGKKQYFVLRDKYAHVSRQQQ